MTPRFLSLGPQEIAELRASKAGELVIEWLEYERERAKELVLAAAVAGDTANQQLRAGSAVTFSHILAALKTPVAISELDAETFRDPARRPNRKDD